MTPGAGDDTGLNEQRPDNGLSGWSFSALREEARAVGAEGAVLVMPGSQWATKAWPEGQFAKFLDETRRAWC